jgi:hypothetical protein
MDFKSEGRHEWLAVLSVVKIIRVQAGNFLSSGRTASCSRTLLHAVSQMAVSSRDSKKFIIT